MPRSQLMLSIAQRQLSGPAKCKTALEKVQNRLSPVLSRSEFRNCHRWLVVGAAGLEPATR